MTDVTDVAARRLDLAGTRAFETTGSGVQRRLRLAEFNREWLGSVWRGRHGGTVGRGCRPGGSGQCGTW